MKKFKLSKKSLMSFALSAIMLVSMSSMAMLCYAWDHPTVEAFKVTLYPEQYKTYSGAMKDTVVDFEGRNCSEEQQCWFYGQYATLQDQSNYKDDDVQIKVKPLTNCSHTKSTTRSVRPWWRLCLDAYGSVNGVYAYGWMW